MRAERVTAALCEHGEGPVWDERAHVLRWVDMVAGTVHALHTDGAVTSSRVGSFAAALRPRRAGGWVVATADAFVLTDDALAPERTIPVEVGPGLRFNDGGCDRDGAFLCGTAGPDGSAALHRLAPDGSTSVVLTGVTISNGLAADPLSDSLFYVDTPVRRIDRLVLAEGRLQERRTFVDLAWFDGVPDGIAVDREGGVWAAMWGGSRVLRFTADGALDAQVELPTPHVSACAFGGPRFDELYITTSRLDLAEPDAEAGALFRVRPGLVGVAPLPFGG